jgi:hypothetical protein
VALLFGLTATYVSMLRGRARQGGSAALVRHRRDRPPKLTGRQVAQAQVWGIQWPTLLVVTFRLSPARGEAGFRRGREKAEVVPVGQRVGVLGKSGRWQRQSCAKVTTSTGSRRECREPTRRRGVESAGET